MNLKPAQEALLTRITAPDYYGEQDENGVDLSLIRENLKLSPVERLRKAHRISKAIEELRTHVRRIS